MVTGWLKLTDEQRRATVQQASIRSGISAKAIEKDWWVTLTLKALFGSAYAGYLVFKGGTSLSKCWGLIERFSEDIDLALDPAAFGMAYKEAPSKTYVEKLRRGGCAFTGNELKTALEKGFAELGVPVSLLNIEAEPVPTAFPDTDPQTLHVHYPSLYAVNAYLADEVRVEVSARSLRVPFAEKLVESILHQVLPNTAYAEEPFPVFAAEPRKTFLEKIFLLHEEFRRPDRTKIRIFRMSRHLYDLSRMAGTDIAESAFADKELYGVLLRHREAYSRIAWMDYDTLWPSTVSFLPPREVREAYRSDYVTMQEQMIYGEAEDFEELIEKLTLLQERLQRKK